MTTEPTEQLANWERDLLAEGWQRTAGEAALRMTVEPAEAPKVSTREVSATVVFIGDEDDVPYWVTGWNDHGDGLIVRLEQRDTHTQHIATLRRIRDEYKDQAKRATEGNDILVAHLHATQQELAKWVSIAEALGFQSGEAITAEDLAEAVSSLHSELAAARRGRDEFRAKADGRDELRQGWRNETTLREALGGALSDLRTEVERMAKANDIAAAEHERLPGEAAELLARVHRTNARGLRDALAGAELLRGPGPRMWMLPDEPGPEVAAVHDSDGREWQRTTHGTWRHILTGGDGVLQLDWTSLLFHGPLTDATGESR